MLVENKSVRQRPEEGYRRWFVDPYFDLIIWYDADKAPIAGFQLCYEKNQNERAITCKIEDGKVIRSHRYVTSSLAAPAKLESKMTAILKGDAGKADPQLVSRFEKESGELEKDLKELILTEMKRFL